MELSIQKAEYLLTCAVKKLRGTGRECPSCGSTDSNGVAAKYLVTQLRRCLSCKLQYRMPVTTETENAKFYQSSYSEGFTTHLPSTHELARLVATCFAGTDRDYTRYLRVLDALNLDRTTSIFDFGCSWGYGTWQLQRHGFQVEAFEISQPRAEYARSQLRCKVHPSLADVTRKFDVFFSSHVLEHVPSVLEVIAVARKLIRPGGYFIAFTPNGSHAYRENNPGTWQKLWGLVHPNFLDSEFYQTCFRGLPLILCSDPFDVRLLSEWAKRSDVVVGDLTGQELLCVARL